MQRKLESEASSSPESDIEQKVTASSDLMAISYSTDGDGEEGTLSRDEGRLEIQKQGTASAESVAKLVEPQPPAVSKDNSAAEESGGDLEDRANVGVGIGITSKAPYRITDLVEGGAASVSGSIKVGDYLLRVAGVDVTRRPFLEVKALILGPVGTDLLLEVDRRRKDGQHTTLSMTIRRTARS